MSLLVWIVIFIALCEKRVCFSSAEESIAYCNRSGQLCCINYYLDEGKCIECPAGWFDENCNKTCPSGTYGRLCGEICYDCETQCHHIDGCLQGNETTSLNFLSKHWIVIFSISGSLLFIAIFAASCIAHFRTKTRKNLWKPSKSSRGVASGKQTLKISPGSCCDVKNRSSSTRLPCKNCAMNPTGKVIVSDLPPEQPKYYQQDQGEPSNHLYSTIGNVDDYESPVKNTTFKARNKGSDNTFEHIPLQIDEKYIMVGAPGANIGRGVHNTELTSYNANAISEEEGALYATANFHKNLLFTENLPPPRL